MKTVKQKLAIATWIILTSFIALSVATYAWMSIATSFKVSDLELNVITENAMEIALATGDGSVPADDAWGTTLSLSELVNKDAALRPVTWSAKDKTFYAPTYGLDGRILSIIEPAKVISLADVPTSSAEAEGEGAGYLLKVEFWLRTQSDKAMTYISGPQMLNIREPLLDENEASSETNSEAASENVTESAEETLYGGSYVIGIPVWNSETMLHDDAGKGAQYAIRIGFMTEDYYIYDSQGNEIKVEDGGFYIYEPNTSHGEITPTIDKSDNEEETLLYEGDGKLIRQEVSSWQDQTPPFNEEVDYTYGEFIDEDTDLFLLTANNPRKVTMYIWLEGQDKDCTNSISAGEILANIHIGAEADSYKEDIGRPTED